MYRLDSYPRVLIIEIRHQESDQVAMLAPYRQTCFAMTIWTRDLILVTLYYLTRVASALLIHHASRSSTHSWLTSLSPVPAHTDYADSE